MEYLSIGRNPIQSAHSSDFVRNGEKSALKTLQWSGSENDNSAVIPVIDNNAFANLDSLETLNLINLNLQKLPDLSNNVDTLRSVGISGHPRLTYLDPRVFFGDPPDFTRTSTIKQLVMDRNSFNTIPSEFLQALGGIEFLRFGYDGIECFPMSALKTLGSLEGIYLENNNIKTVEDIGHRGR